MQARLAELAELVGGAVEGNAETVITGVAIASDAAEGEITFIDSPDNQPLLTKTTASAAVVPAGIGSARIDLIRVGDVHAAFGRIHQHFHPLRETRRIGISPSAMISPSARLAADVDVYAGAMVGEDVEIGPGSTIHSGVHLMAGCRIGQHVTIFPTAVLYENTEVGDHVIIHAGAVLGAYGYGYRMVDGRFELAAQLGNVIIESHVEIGAGTTIDRGAYGATRIGEGSKLDDQVMIGHNCRIGRHNLLCSQVGIAGSSSTGDYVVMAGQVGIRDHVHIGDQAQLGAQSGVRKDVPPGAKWMGSPAMPARDSIQVLSVHKTIPVLRRKVKQLESMVAELQQQIDNPGRNAA